LGSALSSAVYTAATSPDEDRLVRDLAEILLSVNAGRALRSERRVRTGRFDARSIMRAEANPHDDRLFRKVEWTADGFSPLVVIVDLDVSHSMMFAHRAAVSCCAVLVEALELAGHYSACVAWAGESRILKDWGTPGLPSTEITGMFRFSDLNGALETDAALFRRAPGGLQVLVTIGDGEVPDEVTARRWLADFRENGGHSLALHLRAGHHLGEDMVASIRAPGDLARAVTSFVRGFVP